MNITEFLLKLKDNDIDIDLSGDDIEVSYDGRDLPEVVYKEIVDNKPAIVSYLKGVYFNQKKSITIEVRPERIPLSYAQERLWFIDELEGSVQYHIPTVLGLKGGLDEEALEGALRGIVNRHEVLRTVIRQEEGEAYQEVLDPDRWRMGRSDGGTIGENGMDLQGYIGELVARPFDLSVDHMLRAELIGVREDEHILVVVLHHIASDGWSMGILVRELVELYSAAIEGREAVLSPLPVQYADYALWQRRYMSGVVLEEQLGYWKEKLAGATVLELPTDHERPAVQGHRGAGRGYRIGREVLEGLRELSDREGVTLYMTLLAAFQVLLHRYSGQEDICVGSPVAGRMQQEVEGLIGFFINTVVMRSEVKGEMSFRELLREVKEMTLGAYEHQEAPFEKVVEAMVKERDLSRSPLFHVLFTLQNMPQAQVLRLGALQLSPAGAAHATAQFELSFFLEERDSGLGLGILYRTDLFEVGTIDRMAGHYEQLLRSIVADAGQAMGKLRMLTEGEERQLLVAFNDTHVDYSRDKTVVELFEEQAAQTPEAVAVVFEEQSLTYGELDRRTNQLGHYLRGQGVKEDSLVPICMERSLEMIVGILGILKAGGAYVPIDPAYPEDRIRYMLEDSGARWVLTHGALAFIGDRELIDLVDWSKVGQERTGRVERELKPKHLAYMIYTSGSTGRPKGVLVEHGSLLNRLLWAQGYFKLGHADVVLQKTSYGFDVSIWELLWPVVVGARMVFARPGLQGDSEYLRGVIEGSGVTMIHFVPSMLEVFVGDIELGECVGLKKVLCSGEALRAGALRACQERLPQVGIYNLYGPTEATVDVSCWAVPGGRLHSGEVPIGKPVSNTQLYVVDVGGKLCPVGVPGELWIGGVQVARGYWKRPELTAEKFIDNPYAEGRLYKTGDICRWLPDGNIEYLGRRDEQVKVRGYRIELGEIEAVLGECPGVRQGVVMAREDGEGSRRLVGYVVMQKTRDTEGIEEYLGVRLPEYMIPRQWVGLDALPVTGNGKVDRRALPEPDRETRSKGYVVPRNDMEDALVEIWQEILRLDRVGIDNNFFEMGGTSLLMIKLAHLLRVRLRTTVNVITLFQYHTIRKLADHLEAKEATDNNTDSRNGESLLEDIGKFISKTQN